MTFLTIIRLHYKLLYKTVHKTFQIITFLVSRQLIFNQSLYKKCTVAYFDIMSQCERVLHVYKRVLHVYKRNITHFTFAEHVSEWAKFEKNQEKHFEFW